MNMLYTPYPLFPLYMYGIAYSTYSGMAKSRVYGMHPQCTITSLYSLRQDTYGEGRDLCDRSLASVEAMVVSLIEPTGSKGRLLLPYRSLVQLDSTWNHSIFTWLVNSRHTQVPRFKLVWFSPRSITVHSVYAGHHPLPSLTYPRIVRYH